jgi:hypothetical protein
MRRTLPGSSLLLLISGVTFHQEMGRHFGVVFRQQQLIGSIRLIYLARLRDGELRSMSGGFDRRGRGQSIEELLGDYGADAVTFTSLKFMIDRVGTAEWRSGRKPPGLRSAEELGALLGSSPEAIRAFDEQLVAEFTKEARFDEPLGWLRWTIDEAPERWRLRWGNPP